MILSCPSCATRYTLTEAQLGPQGRKVRCAACKTTWHAEAPAKEEAPIDLTPKEVAPVKERVEDLAEVKAKKLPSKYRAILEDKRRLRTMTAQGLIWACLAGALIMILGLGYALRVDIVKAFPRVAGAYAMTGITVDWSHLAINRTEVTGDRAFRDGRFFVTIKAPVKNLSNKPVPVPPVHVKLLDESGQQFDETIIYPGALMVPAGAVRTLTFDVPDPRNLTRNVDLGFDLEAMKALKRPGAHTPAGHEHDAIAEDDPAHPHAEAPPAETAHASPHEEAVASTAIPEQSGEAPSDSDHGETSPEAHADAAGPHHAAPPSSVVPLRPARMHSESPHEVAKSEAAKPAVSSGH